jgi:hypothetical protein
MYRDLTYLCPRCLEHMAVLRILAFPVALLWRKVVRPRVGLVFAGPTCPVKAIPKYRSNRDFTYSCWDGGLGT